MICLAKQQLEKVVVEVKIQEVNNVEQAKSKLIEIFESLPEINFVPQIIFRKILKFRVDFLEIPDNIIIVCLLTQTSPNRLTSCGLGFFYSHSSDIIH